MARGKRPAEKPSDDAPIARSGPGRPRLTPEALQERIAAYCKAHGVSVTAEGLPPFPSGRRETPQHREWMALYKAQRRIAGRTGAAGKDAARIRELLEAQRGRCPICRKPLDIAEATLDAASSRPAALHIPCSQLLALARSVGKDAFERVKDRL